MAKRGWSLTDAQLERRKQNPAARRSVGAAKPKPRLSNTQQRRKAAGSPQTGLQPGATTAGHGPSQAAQNIIHDNPRTYDSSGRPNPRTVPYPSGPPSAAEVDWTGPDARSLNNPARGTDVRQEFREYGPNLSNPYRNEPTYSTGPTRKGWEAGPSRLRQASTQAAYRAADASMFNSTVTPKAKRVEDKKPRSRMSPDQNVFW
jgi:hypothetical protein